MSNSYENCGCPVYSGRCTNCHEELYILDQYYELGMELPDSETEFMRNVDKHLKDTSEPPRQESKVSMGAYAEYDMPYNRRQLEK